MENRRAATVCDMKKAWRDDYSNERVTVVIGDYIHSSRDREIILANLIDGVSYDELAGQYSLAYESIKDIMRKARATLNLHYDPQ